MTKINYKDGIRFKCQGSGNCCVSRDSYGYVYLSKNDLRRFSKYFNLSVQKFKKKYCQISDGFIHLIEKKSFYGKCIFLKDNKCTVYKARPTQCRTWPFWNENMNVKIWNEDISKNCPGIGKGKKIKFDTIKKILDKEEENDMLIFKNRVNLQK